MAYATVDELAAALRISVTAGNTAALQSCLDAAALEINSAVDVPPGSLAGGRWLYSTVTAAADPGAGYLRLDKGSLPAVKKLYVDPVDADNVDRAAGLVTVTTDDLVDIRDYATSVDWARYVVTGAAIDHAGWIEVPLNYDTGSGTLVLTQAEPVLLSGLRPSVQIGNRLALAKRVNILRGVEWWKSNDAAWNVLSDVSGALRLPRNTFARHAAALLPLKQRWGIS